MSLHGSKNTARTQSSTVTTPGSVAVEIRGQKLSIRSDKDPRRVEELAAFIDTKAAQLQAMAPGVPLDKILMLVSMTVAEELFDARDQNTQLREQIKARVDAALKAVEEAEHLG
ncbi:MAG: cell division protein ZapA [bacterium]